MSSLPRLLLIVLVCFVCGCPPPVVAIKSEPVKPDEGRQAWVDALSAGDGERAWGMMAPAARTRWGDKSSFANWCRKHCAAVAVQVMSQDEEPRRLARVGSLVLVSEAGSWRVLSAPHDGPPRTPSLALAGLRALLAERVGDPLLAPTLRARMGRMVAALDRLLGSRGPLPKAKDGRLELVLEPGLTITLEKVSGGAWHVLRWGP